MIHHRRASAKIVARRRSRRRPLQSSRLPRIVARLRSLEHAPEQVEQEHKLNGDSHECRIGHKCLQRNQLSLISHFGELRVAPRLARQSQIMHRHENRIRAGEGDEEMNLSQPLIHHSAQHLREPIIRSSEDSEDRRNSHDQMEMANHEVSVVQGNIQHRLSQERPTESARHEQRNEADGEQHRRLQPNASAPKRTEPVESLNSRRHANRHRHDGERKRRIGAHSAHEHVVSPHHESQKPDGHEGISHSLISEDGFAREGRDHLRGHAHSGQNCDVNLRVPKEPEQVLPQQWRAAFVAHHLTVHNHQRHIEACTQIAIEQ